MLGILYFLDKDGEKVMVEANKQLSTAIQKYRKQCQTDSGDSSTKVVHGRKVLEPTNLAYVQAWQ